MIKMIITDLDGTLLNRQQVVSEQDFNNLVLLGEQGYTRVIATGRSPFSFSKVIPRNFPIDYLVFSSGAGVMDWGSQEIIQSFSLSEEMVLQFAEVLRDHGQNFKILDPIPNNQYYTYYQNGDLSSDFIRRMELYKGYERLISFDPPNFGAASQFLIILPDEVSEFERLAQLCQGAKVLRATSPIDHESIWMEVLHPAVSKANGCAFLCDQLGIGHDQTLAVGNDYNDIDLLDFTAQSYIVSNAPDELKNQYNIVNSHEESGFSHALSVAGLDLRS